MGSNASSTLSSEDAAAADTNHSGVQQSCATTLCPISFPLSLPQQDKRANPEAGCYQSGKRRLTRLLRVAAARCADLLGMLRGRTRTQK